MRNWSRWIWSGCDHEWLRVPIHGDARQFLGRTEEWRCLKCHRISGKEPRHDQ